MRHLLLSGGPGHDFEATAAAITAIAADAGFDTTVVTEPADAIEALRAAEHGGAPKWHLLTVHALRWRMQPDRYASERDRFAYTLDDDDDAVLDEYVTAGGGLVALHTAVICFDADPAWHALVGATWNWGRSHHPPLATAAIEPTAAGREHAITRDTLPFTVVDELYCDLDVDPAVVPLLVGGPDEHHQPVLWARAHGRGRVVTDVLGHGVDSLHHPVHRALLARATRWAVGSPLDATPDRAPVAPRSRPA